MRKTHLKVLQWWGIKVFWNDILKMTFVHHVLGRHCVRLSHMELHRPLHISNGLGPPGVAQTYCSLLPLRASQSAACTDRLSSCGFSSPCPPRLHYLRHFSFISIRVDHDPSASLGGGRPLVFRPSIKSKGKQQQSELQSIPLHLQAGHLPYLAWPCPGQAPS